MKKANFQGVILICDRALSSKYVYSLEDYKHNLISIIFAKELTVFEKRAYYFLNTLRAGVNSSGSQKAAVSNVALRMNISAPVRSSDSAKISKNVVSLVD